MPRRISKEDFGGGEAGTTLATRRGGPGGDSTAVDRRVEQLQCGQRTVSPNALAGNSMCPPQNAHKHFKNFAWTGSTCSFRCGGVGGAGLCGTTGAGAEAIGRAAGCDTGGVPGGIDDWIGCGIGIWRGTSAGAALRAISGCEASGSLTTIRGGRDVAGVVDGPLSCLVSKSFSRPARSDSSCCNSECRCLSHSKSQRS